jgi:hypothetical protein
MGNVNIVKKEYKGWKNCIEISNGIIEAVATTDVGPRIIRFGFIGKENELCEVEEQIGTAGSSEWQIYGGHRLWHSPEAKPRTYELDNSKIQWRKKKNGIVLDQPVEPWTHIKKDMELIMSPAEAKVTVIHRLTNKGAWDVEFSVWALSVMAPGGKEIMPQVKKEFDLLPSWSITFWPYTRLNDPRVFWGEKYISLQQDKNTKSPFKIGFPCEDGWAAYANHGHLFLKKFQHYSDAVYPDTNSSYETYTTDFMLEMETLSPLVLLAPGETIEHVETWYLYDNVKVPATEKDIEEIVLPLVNK